ncbi:hypothetical protein AURDEDRAFT_173560 [Auricularia subglabra TFB-10046 SS5]|nr:hypothetical protein AURDEDRAFT_173560 [Auricularia subglabra TFB-10046 SS5]
MPSATTRVGALPRKASLDDTDEKCFSELPIVGSPKQDVVPVRRPSPTIVACAIICLLLTYAAWSVWLYYYFRASVWPLPRGPLNSTDGLLHSLSIVTKTFIVVLGLASLVIPLVLYKRSHQPGRDKSLLQLYAWVFLGAVLALIPLVLYYGFLCFMQNQAFSTPCNASEDVTVYFAGSAHGLSRNGTTATLYSTSDPATKLGTYTLKSTGPGGAAFTRSDGGGYFHVEYAINDGMNSTVAMAFTTEDGPVAFGAAGNLMEMSIAPQNVTLRALGEVMEHPVNFRLVDNSSPNDTVLRTVATNPRSCRSLKLCAKGWTDAEKQATVLIPMGWALYKHAAYAFGC